MSRPLDLAEGVLDHQLLDADGRRCGKVADLRLDGLHGRSPEVAELLIGAAALRPRGRLGRLAAHLARRRVVHVPWTEVARVDSAVRLRSRAADLRLGRGDERAARWVRRLPGSGL